MAYITTTDMKPGVKIEIDNQPYVIVHNDIVRPGKGQAFNRIRIKNLLNNKTIEITMKSGDRADLADVVEVFMRMLYREISGVERKGSAFGRNHFHAVPMKARLQIAIKMWRPQSPI